MASACLNIPFDESQVLTFVESPTEIQYPEPMVWRFKCQLYGLRVSPRSWQIHLTQVLQRMGSSQTISNPCAFTGNIASTSRAQASVSHSSAEAELCAMTQASVESLAIKHFTQELRSNILSRDVQRCGEDRFIGRQDNGLRSRHFRKIKTH